MNATNGLNLEENKKIHAYNIQNTTYNNTFNRNVYSVIHIVSSNIK